jgi:hypothetical protein
VHFERAEPVFFPRPQRIPANTTLLRDFTTESPDEPCNKMIGGARNFPVRAPRSSLAFAIETLQLPIFLSVSNSPPTH